MTLLAANNIDIAYAGKTGSRRIVQNVSLEAAAGEVLALMGASGAGKSSFLRVLAGLAKPAAGTVALFGEPVKKPHPRLGFVFQDSPLLPWLNVRDNVGFGLGFKHQPFLSRRERRLRVDEAIAEVGLEHAATALPAELSGGMAQRAALARVLARQPAAWLLDEPFSALDAITRAQLQSLLRELVRRHNTAAIMVTHDVDEALAVADRAILLGGSPAGVAGAWQLQGRDDAAVRAGILQTLTDFSAKAQGGGRAASA